jgi:uncharacterized membrane protein
MKDTGIAKKITIYALSIALVCISTTVIQIPIPLGYMHLGNTMILATAFLFGPGVGFCAGGFGSMIADLITGYAYWSLPTLIIKGIMGFAIGAVAYKMNSSHKVFTVKTFAGAILGIVIMISGYFIAGSIIYGSVYTGALQIPGLTTEGVIGIVLFYVLCTALEKAGFSKLLKRI